MSGGTKPGGGADKGLGDIVGDVTQKASLLVREEIELAKAEVTEKGKKLGKGAAFIAVAGFLMLLFLIFLFHMLAFGFAEWFDLQIWVGYAIVCVILLLIAGVLAFLALRAFKKGSPPTPEMAIDEAKKTRAAIEEARS